MKKIMLVLMAALPFQSMATTQQNIELRIIQTSDVHGCFFPYDFIERKPKEGTMARVITYVDSLRNIYGDRLLLLDNGDILQGQPTCYYSNFVNPQQPNIAASVINYMKYDAQTIGNHDVETGHAVYDKWIKETKCPMLGANVTNTHTNTPYLKPYAIFNRAGVKIAVLGMLTPAIPNWLNKSLWSGLRFEEMVSCAKKWMAIIQRDEKPDIVIGLFHSGKDGGIHTEQYDEDASIKVAREVPGFDLVLYGHDHTLHSDVIRNVAGKDVVCLDPSCNALFVSDTQITISRDSKGTHTKVNGKLVDIRGEKVDKAFVKHFDKEVKEVRRFVDRKIGRFQNAIYTRDCYFGSAAFTDFIHDLQLSITGADVSFNAPLSFDTAIPAGDVHISDMFNLYKYENQIYVLKMTGDEIRKHLEMSYDLWVNTMKSPDDHIMLLNEEARKDKQRFGFKNLAFNFDSAAGIDYEVDVTKPDGQKVHILRMSNGEPFDLKKTYRVAMNSYRGNGGGELLTKGAGIAKEELPKRIVFESERDQRYYLTKEIEKAKVMNPQAHNNWRFVPKAWTKQAIERDRKLLFPHSKQQ